jgi:molybdenum cofactor cytidylyltransferase
MPEEIRHISAIIPAAGCSSRMHDFKPFLKLGDASFLERAVQLFQDAGIQDIRVVIGHRHEDILSRYGHLAVHWCFNPDFKKGMFTSILAGVKDLPSPCRAFFMLPVDIPLVRTSTIRELLRKFYKTGCAAAHPCLSGRRGHPPLISTGLIPAMLKWRGENGLKGFLAQHDAGAVDVETADEGILLDADTKEDYNALVLRHRQGDIPSPEECMALLTEKFRVPGQIIDHSLMVTRLALALGRHLNRSGYGLNLHLITAAALLHDMARQQPDHANVGADILNNLGFPEVSEIVRSHMDITESPKGPITEEEIVYLADKFVQADRIVPMENRFTEKLKRHATAPHVREAVMERFEKAMAVKARWEKAAGKPIGTILTDSSLAEEKYEPVGPGLSSP